MADFPIETMDQKPFAFVPRQADMKDIPQAMQEGFGLLMSGLTKAGAEPIGPAYCHYLSYDDNSAVFELGFVIAPEDVDAVRDAGLDVSETVSGTVMKATHIGPYETLEQTYNAMMAQMEANGLKGTTEMWEAYFSPPDTPPAEIKTEVYWPVEAVA